MTTVLQRIDVWSTGDGYYPVEEVPNAEGDYVKAQDAYDRLAVLNAEIATLKTQLKDARTEIVKLISEKRK